jgi:hypothetical protein
MTEIAWTLFRIVAEAAFALAAMAVLLYCALAVYAVWHRLGR